MNNQAQWKEVDGKLVRIYTGKDFMGCVALVNKIAAIAESAQHHPNLYIYDYKLLRIELQTHDTSSITEKDRSLATQIDELIQSA